MESHNHLDSIDEVSLSKTILSKYGYPAACAFAFIQQRLKVAANWKNINAASFAKLVDSSTYVRIAVPWILGEMPGTSDSSIRRALKELVNDGILLRNDDDINWYAINADKFRALQLLEFYNGEQTPGQNDYPSEQMGSQNDYPGIQNDYPATDFTPKTESKASKLGSQNDNPVIYIESSIDSLSEIEDTTNIHNTTGVVKMTTQYNNKPEKPIIKPKTYDPDGVEAKIKNIPFDLTDPVLERFSEATGATTFKTISQKRRYEEGLVKNEERKYAKEWIDLMIQWASEKKWYRKLDNFITGLLDDGYYQKNIDILSGKGASNGRTKNNSLRVTNSSDYLSLS